MLQIVNGRVLDIIDYCIIHNADGIDELRFKISINDPLYREIEEEMRLFETTERQTYKVTFLDASARDCTVVATLDLDAFKSTWTLDLATGLKTVSEIVNHWAKPTSWTLTGATPKTQKCNIEMQCPTRYDIMLQVQERFSCNFRFSTSSKTMRLIYPNDEPLSNAYIIDSVNLRQPPMYKGNSGSLYTRIIPIGGNDDDGNRITIENVPKPGGGVWGKTYIDAADIIETPYTTKPISKVWSDSRYTDAQSLFDAACDKLREAAFPVRSWTVDVIDLKSIDAAKWPDMDMSIFKRVRLVDRYKGLSADVQIVQTKSYPYFPEKNVVSVSTTVRSVKKSINYLLDQVESPNSALWQKIGG